jgi:5-methylthioadenosine/S-adenosylhomocysteine deaminase
MAADAFERRYLEGVPDRLQPPPRGRSRAGLRAAPSEPFALRGCVITPRRKIDNGYVLISGATIGSVGKAKPDSSVKVIDTGGVILPGLIDLHGHPEYNVFSAWEPPQRFSNRYRWRSSPVYKRVVREPWSTLAKGKGSLLRDLTRYAEARALVAGVTAIQGASAMYPSKEEALVRNVDLNIFGQHRARSTIDPLNERDEKVKEFRDDIAAGEITALYVHLAEGTDQRSENEFGRFVKKGLLTGSTVIIHGTALTDEMFGQVKEAGAKLVWSPQSNLRLYGQTTSAATALRLGIPTGMGADWMPSGSPSLLDEIKVARRVLVEQEVGLDQDELHRKLVRMVTDEAAAIAGLDGFLGTLERDRPADLVVLERRLDDPWRNIVEAGPAWVQLVAIGGDLAYGRPDWVGALVDRTPYEEVLAWGRPMLIDTSYRARASGATAPPSLSEIRGNLLGRYPQTGPIFA